MKAHGSEVFNLQLRSCGADSAQFVQFAHGVVEDGGDDAAVAVSGRASVAFAEAKPGHETLLFLGEFQVHALGIVVSAGEAEVFLYS